jgi:hypothetical protein
MRICKDCKHFLCEGLGTLPDRVTTCKCINPKNPAITDLVFGTVTFKYTPQELRAGNESDYGKFNFCGKSGSWFEEIPPKKVPPTAPPPPPIRRIREGIKIV